MKNFLVINAFILFSLFQVNQNLHGQTSVDTLSLNIAPEDSMAGPTIILSEKVLSADSITMLPVSFKPDPAKATWYAIVCPGLGQIYNRSYWKVPVLYGGIATLSYLIIWNGKMYNDYKNAYQDIMDNNPNTNSFAPLFYNMNGDLSWMQNTLKRKRDYYRRYRDLSIFGMAALYVISVVDAFVDAQLYDFSVTDDLSLHVEPVVKTPLFYHENSLASTTMMGFQCTINF